MKFSLNWLNELIDLNDIKLEDLLRDISLKSIEIEGYSKMVDATKLVVGEVLEKEKHPDADKLSVCMVNLGNETKQIICGAPNVDKGQKVIVAIDGAVLPGNFKIKKSSIRGVESNGMICSLAELGIDKKYVEEAYQDGIYVLNSDAKVGEDAIKELGFDDYSIELGLTPNRSDLLSMLGIAHDMKAIYNREIKYPVIDYNTINKDVNDYIEIKLESKNCLAYYATMVENITIKESPKWMKSRLIASGIRPINNVVDITNYILLEYGQPLHAFDYDALASKEIIVRDAKTDEILITLDEQERKLINTDLLITNGKEPIALAGVMGGLKTEVTTNTKRVLIESAIFDPITIRKTSSRLNLRSEASMRFERQIDVNRTQLAAKRAVQLLEKYADASVYKGIAFVDNADKQATNIEISLENLNKYLGTSISQNEFEDIVTRLDFTYEKQSNLYNVIVPKRRPDVTKYQDIYEELGRIYGYENIKSTIPLMETIGKKTNSQIWRRQIKTYLKDIGLSQTLTYSLTKKSKLEAFKDFLPNGYEYINLNMPMSEEKATLRTTLIPSLLEVLQYNKARQISNLGIFEIGNRYYKLNNELHEDIMLVGAVHNIYNESLWQGKLEKVDFYLVKGILENLFEKLDLSERFTFDVLDKETDVLHPNRQAKILFDRKEVGYLAQIHPNYAKSYNLKEVYVYSINLKSVLNRNHRVKKFQSIQKYPNIERDIAIVVNKDINASMLIDSIKKSGKRLLKDVFVFDLYVGDNIDEDKKSLAFKLTFGSPDKTMTDDEINVIITSILEKLEKDFNAQLRS